RNSATYAGSHSSRRWKLESHSCRCTKFGRQNGGDARRGGTIVLPSSSPTHSPGSAPPQHLCCRSTAFVTMHVSRSYQSERGEPVVPLVCPSSHPRGATAAV